MCVGRCERGMGEGGGWCEKPEEYRAYRFGGWEQCVRMISEGNCRRGGGGEGVFEVCREGFEMRGNDIGVCRYKCPDGTVENEGKCEKKGAVFVGKPFPWCPQDEL
jgi:hypothetical protein